MHNTPHTEESKQKMSEALKGKKYPNRKKRETYKQKEGSQTGKHHKGTKWYNNGEIQRRCKEHPGEGWIRGQLGEKAQTYRRGFLRRELESWAGRNKEKTPFCEWCFSEDNLEAHHILPKKKFPQLYNVDSNCRVMCKSCHITCHKQGGY